MALTGQGLHTSVLLTASGTTIQQSTLFTSAASVVSRLELCSLKIYLADESSAIRTHNFGLSIGNRIILGGSVLGISNGGAAFVTASGGTRLRNLVSVTPKDSGQVLTAIDLTSAFVSTTATVPVDGLNLRNATLTDESEFTTATSHFATFSDGLLWPLFVSNGDLLRAFYYLDGAGTVGQCAVKLSCRVTNDVYGV